MRSIPRHNVSRSELYRRGDLIIRRRPANALPVIRFSSGVITEFERSGVLYRQIIASLSGQFRISAPVVVRGIALLAGGATGGMRGTGQSAAGGGGGGFPWLREEFELPAGVYNFTLGAGGAPVSTSVQGNDGSDSVISGPIEAEALGGGGGGTAVNTDTIVGRPGGCGGGGGGGSATGGAAGDGNPGFDGGVGFFGVVAVRAGGGGGGAGGPGGNSASGVAGLGGLGLAIPWLEPARTVGRGGNGSLGATQASPNEVDGNGSNGNYLSVSGAGGNSWLGLVVRADAAAIEVAA